MAILATNQWDVLPAFFNGVASFDPDSATWICEQLDEKFGLAERYMKPCANLYSSVILSESQTAVKIAAASNLASILEGKLSSETEYISQIELPSEDLAQGFRPQKEFERWNRQATDAELRLQGCLLALRSTTEGQNLTSLNRDIHDWTVKLRSALSEETVRLFKLRYSESMLTFY